MSFQTEGLFGARSRYRLSREKVMPALWRVRPEVAGLGTGCRRWTCGQR
ncbi:MAG: hypothetical protein ACODAJ_16710 [Planctomycetota bacterium]